jgi:hypothetical protein
MQYSALRNEVIDTIGNQLLKSVELSERVLEYWRELREKRCFVAKQNVKFEACDLKRPVNMRYETDCETCVEKVAWICWKRT